MKLSDIFKLDLNTGGGNKLFARIMNKYNVPKKEYENVKQEMNSFSGGGDSGSSDVEYFKTPNGAGKSNFIALYKNKTSDGISISTKFEEYVHQTIAIAYLPITYEGVIYYSFKDYLRVQFSDMSDEEFENQFTGMVTPITKEEFYDLNNI